jgi:hypothetical protein
LGYVTIAVIKYCISFRIITSVRPDYKSATANGEYEKIVDLDSANVSKESKESKKLDSINIL